MKTILTTLFALSISVNFASSPGSSVFGTVKDNSTRQPLEFAQAALIKPADSSLVTGGISDLDGNFKVTAPAQGDYLLRVSFVGYNDFWKPVKIENGDNPLGILSLIPASTELRGVEITAAAMLARTDGEKRIYNVENMAIAEGGTAAQVLETLPSVQVDQDGNISLRGSSNVLILINGRPATLTGDDTGDILRQYPANMIKEVELITNPSARYDAEGVGGIINIVLKEKRTPGVNGQLSASSGTGNKYTSGAIINYKKNKINLSANYSFQYRESWRTSMGYREFLSESTLPILNQNDRNENLQLTHVLRTGFDYQFNSNNSLRLFSSLNFSNNDSQGIYNSILISGLNQLESLNIRLADEERLRNNYEFGASYNWKNDKGSSLNLQATWAYQDQTRNEFFDQSLFSDLNQEIPLSIVNQLYEQPSSNQSMVFDADFERRISETMRIETGFKSSIRNDVREQVLMDYDFATEAYIIDPQISNQFRYDDQVYAGYLIFRDRRGKFSYQAGLRAEYTMTESYQPLTDFTYNYDYFSLFPSFFTSYDLGSKQSIQANYSRRIRRPWIGSLAPFMVVQDQYSFRSGNPFLKPEFTDNFEVNYSKGWEKYSLVAGVFHRYTTQALSRIVVPAGEATMVVWENGDTRNSTGLEVVNSFNFSRNLNARLTGNLFNTTVSARTGEDSFSNQRLSWSLSLLGNYNMPKYFSTQVTAFYQGPIVIPQGEILPVFGLNLGFRRNVLNQQGTVSLNVSDVFNTRRFALKTNSDVFNLDRDFRFESRVVTLAFTWRFLGYRERNGFNRDMNFGGEMEELF